MSEPSSLVIFKRDDNTAPCAPVFTTNKGRFRAYTHVYNFSREVTFVKLDDTGRAMRRQTIHNAGALSLEELLAMTDFAKEELGA